MGNLIEEIIIIIFLIYPLSFLYPCMFYCVQYSPCKTTLHCKWCEGCCQKKKLGQTKQTSLPANLAWLEFLGLIKKYSEMYGIAIKLWTSHFDKDSESYKTDDSVVYVFGESSAEDILYVSSVVNHLTGDQSLDALYRKLAPNVKGEPISVDEPIVKLEQEDYDSGGEEDFKGGFYHENPELDYREAKAPSRTKKSRRRDSSSEYSEDEDEEDYQVRVEHSHW